MSAVVVVVAAVVVVVPAVVVVVVPAVVVVVAEVVVVVVPPSHWEQSVQVCPASIHVWHPTQVRLHPPSSQPQPVVWVQQDGTLRPYQRHVPQSQFPAAVVVVVAAVVVVVSAVVVVVAAVVVVVSAVVVVVVPAVVVVVGSPEGYN